MTTWSYRSDERSGDLTIPTCAEDITPEWLSAALGATVTSIDVTPIGSRAGLKAARSRLRVTYRGETGPTSLIAKYPSEGNAGRSLAEGLGMYRREMSFYEHLAERAGVPLAECVYAEHDDETQDFVLLLSDLPEARVVDQLLGCSVAEAALAVERLADLHASFWDDDDVATVDGVRTLGDSPLPETAVRWFRASWGPAQILYGDIIPAPIKELGDRFHEILPEVMRRLSTPPTTLSHGDYRLGNLLFSAADLAIGDWQLVDRSRGARDLAYFIVGSLPPRERAKHEIDLVAAYESRLWANGVTDYSSRACWDDYLLSVLFNFAYAIVAGGVVHGKAHARAITAAGIERSCAAILDLDCLALVNAD